MNRNFIVIVLFLLFAGPLIAQTFEFTENKGQWDQAVRYKGELSGGAFFLKKNGYRVLQHHPTDYAQAIEALAGKHVFGPAPGKEMKSAVSTTLPEVEGGGNGGGFGPVVRSHAYDVSFEGSSPKVGILPERELAGYSNYFIGNDPAKWQTGVKSYSALRYSGIYPGVDARFYSDEGYLKYDLVIQPNANVGSIVLHYEGATVTRQRNGDLLVKTSVNEVVEKSPYAYQLENGVRKVIDCQYVVKGDKVSFKLGDYNKGEVLVIDPTLVFSTFSGSTTDNWGYTATYDGAGNAYGGGIVFGTGWPVTTGAFQTTYGGGSTGTGESACFDIGIMKLSPTANQRLFSTYLGGSGNEQPHSLVVDGSGNLIVAGRTTSSNFPVLNNNKVGQLGGWDIIVTKFNPSGTALLGSIQIGGTGDDGVNIKHKTTGSTGPSSLFQNYGDDARSEVLTDRSGNIYVASCTRSNNFPATAGVFQTALRGNQDALVLKFNPSLSLTFATLLGGDSDDAAYVLYVDNDNSILVAGGTASTNFPGDKTNTVGPTFTTPAAGATFSSDGFIAKIRDDGTSIIKSTYIGTSGIDQIYGIQEDRNGYLYVMGTNTGGSTSNFPIRNAAFSQAGGKQFIAKLQPDLSDYVYSTVFGTPTGHPNISPTDFLVDRCENVYVSGWGGEMGGQTPYQNAGTNGLTVTTDAIDRTTDGKDFYFIVIEKDAASQLYGTFFGQQDAPNSGTPDHVDGGTSRFDPQGVIYQGICANCSPGQFPTTPGVIAPSKPSTALCNLAVIKINFELAGVASGIKSSIDGVDGDTSACAPTLVNFRDTIAIAQSYQWDFGDGSPEVTTTDPQASHNYTIAGTYRVRLIAIDLNKCFPRDTSYVNIRVRTDRVTVNASATKLDPCESLTYRFNNLSTVIPSKPFSDTSFTWVFGDNTAPVKANNNSVTHQFPSPGTYTVSLILTDTNYCNAPDSFSIVLRVSPEVVADFEVVTPGCAPYTAVFNNTSSGGQTFEWDFGNGQTSTDINPTALFTVPGSYTVRLIAHDPTTCNQVDTTTMVVDVLDKPQAAFTFSPNPSEENIPTTFTNYSQTAVAYKWIFGDGDTLFTTRRDTLVRHQYRQSGTFNVCLVTISNIGCSDTLCQPVEAFVDPMVDVVTAFTPNNDGVNDRAVIIGFGVVRLNFKIFNRWGQLMFETNDSQLGWDGKYKGKPQPMDAYGYTLEAELLTGQKIIKKGSITLVR